MTSEKSTNLGIAHRVILMILSLSLIVVTLTTDGMLGWKVAFPLLAISPGVSALTGWDPIYAAVTAFWAGVSSRRAEHVYDRYKVTT